MANKIKICTIFKEAQKCRVAHRRCSLSMIDIFHTVPYEEFAKVFVNSISIAISFQDLNEFVDNTLRFAAVFVAELINKNKGERENADDEPTHPLLREIILVTLRYCKNEDSKKRFNACNFISTLLEMIADDYILDNDICDAIQATMLNCIRDPKSLIRERAVVAMQRLQDPSNNDCPVIAAYMNSFYDPVASVRAKLLEVCAPCTRLVPVMVESIYDVASAVRMQAFRRFTQMKPMWLKIVEKQNILQRGFQEADKRVRQVFIRDLLPKWLAAYNGNFLELLRAVTLDANDKDLETTDLLWQEMLREFLKAHPVLDFLNYLPLDEHRLIPHKELKFELVIFWNSLYGTISKMENADELTEKIVPDLTLFCKYIEEYISKQNNTEMDQFQFLEYQHILKKLLDMSLHFDISDEVGRKALHQLTREILSKRTLQRDVIKTLLCILEKFSNNTDAFIKEVIDLDRTIMDPPVIEKEPSPQEIQQFNYKLAGLDVKINIANEEVEDAIATRDLQLAAKKQEALEKLVAEKELFLAARPQPKRIQTSDESRSSTHTTLEVLNCLLEMRSVKHLPENLRSFIEEQLGDMTSFKDIEHQLLAFKTCCLYAVRDKNWATKYLSLIYKPIILHRTIQREVDVQLLLTSIRAVGDLIYRYGKGLFNKSDSDSQIDQTACKRRLYNPDMEDDAEPNNLEEISIQTLIETISAMLASETFEIKETASYFLARVLRYGYCVSARLFARIFIEWCNPLNLQNSPALQVVFGEAMYHFSRAVNNSHSVIESSVIPALFIIGNAPKTSPLADISLDSVINFLCKITLPLTKNSITNTHKNLAYLLCTTLDKNLEDKCSIIWAKMLLKLEPPFEEKAAIQELKGQVEGLLEDVVNKHVKVKLRKYQGILISCLEDKPPQNTEEGVTEISVTIANELQPTAESGRRDSMNDFEDETPRLSKDESKDSSASSAVDLAEVEKTSENPKKKPRLSTDESKDSSSSSAVDLGEVEKPSKNPKKKPRLSIAESKDSSASSAVDLADVEKPSKNPKKKPRLSKDESKDSSASVPADLTAPAERQDLSLLKKESKRTHNTSSSEADEDKPKPTRKKIKISKEDKKSIGVPQKLNGVKPNSQPVKILHQITVGKKKKEDAELMPSPKRISSRIKSKADTSSKNLDNARKSRAKSRYSDIVDLTMSSEELDVALNSSEKKRSSRTLQSPERAVKKRNNNATPKSIRNEQNKPLLSGLKSSKDERREIVTDPAQNGKNSRNSRRLQLNGGNEVLNNSPGRKKNNKDAREEKSGKSEGKKPVLSESKTSSSEDEIRKSRTDISSKESRPNGTRSSSTRRLQSIEQKSSGRTEEKSRKNEGKKPVLSASKTSSSEDEIGKSRTDISSKKSQPNGRSSRRLQSIEHKNPSNVKSKNNVIPKSGTKNYRRSSLSSDGLSNMSSSSSERTKTTSKEANASQLNGFKNRSSKRLQSPERRVDKLPNVTNLRSKKTETTETKTKEKENDFNKMNGKMKYKLRKSSKKSKRK